jgi:hypothetical protein
MSDWYALPSPFGLAAVVFVNSAALPADTCARAARSGADQPRPPRPAATNPLDVAPATTREARLP